MIEFVEQDGPDQPDEELLERGRPPVRRPIRIAVAVALAAVGGFAVVQTVGAEHGTRKAAASTSAAPSTTSRTLAFVPQGNACQLTSDGKERCFLDHLPRAVRTALRESFPSARIVTSSAGEIDPDGRLVDRQLSVDAGTRKLDIRIEDGRVAKRPFRTQDAPGVRITSVDVAITHRRHVHIEVIDLNRRTVPRALLERLARDRRLLATA